MQCRQSRSENPAPMPDLHQPAMPPTRHGRGSVSNSLRAGKITGNLQNYGLLRRFWQPVGERVQLLAAKFPEPSEQGSFFVLTGNSSSRTVNLRDRAASCQAAWVAPRGTIVRRQLRDIGDGVSKIRVMSKPVGLRRGSVRLLEP